MKLTLEQKEFFEKLDAAAKAMGFGDTNLAAYAATVPEPKDYTGLEVGIRQDDGSVETLVYGENGFEEKKNVSLDEMADLIDIAIANGHIKFEDEE